MEFDDKTLDMIRTFGGHNMDPRSICIRLELTKAESRFFMHEFQDPDSEIRHAWENGRIDKQMDIEGKLEGHVAVGGEGSGEAARALGYLQRKKVNDALKYELFGV